MQVLGDKVDYKLPAMDYEFKRSLVNKADLSVVESLMEKKVDKEFVERLIERINGIEETATAAKNMKV